MSARGLLIGGALLVGLSIMLPWYEVRLPTFGIAESMSGFDAREQASVALVILAAVACGGFSVRREVPLLAAAAVAVLVVASFVAVPGVPNSGEPTGSEETPFLSASVSLDTSRSWGLWVAAAGAAAMLVGAARQARRQAM